MFSEEKKEQKINEKFAEKYGLSIEQLNKAAEEEYEKLNPEDFPSDDARKGRALRRARGGFRAIAAKMKNSKDGMIVCRFRDSDFARNQYNRAKRVEANEGTEAAIKQKLMNKEGQPIFQYGNDIGKVIAKPTAFGGAAGYFIDYKDGERIITPKYISIGENYVNNEIPICQLGRLSVNNGKKVQENFPYSDDNIVWYNASTLDDDHQAPYSAEEIVQILSDWNEAFGTSIPAITTRDELADFGREHCQITKDDGHQYDFCYVPARIAQVMPITNPYEDVRVVIEFLDSETLEDEILNVFIPQGAFQGLYLQEDRLGICILQSYDFSNKKDDTQHKWHLGGFLPVQNDVEVERFFGVSYGGIDEDV